MLDLCTPFCHSTNTIFSTDKSTNPPYSELFFSVREKGKERGNIIKMSIVEWSFVSLEKKYLSLCCNLWSCSPFLCSRSHGVEGEWHWREEQKHWIGLVINQKIILNLQFPPALPYPCMDTVLKDLLPPPSTEWAIIFFFKVLFPSNTSLKTLESGV